MDGKKMKMRIREDREESRRTIGPQWHNNPISVAIFLPRMFLPRLCEPLEGGVFIIQGAASGMAICENSARLATAAGRTDAANLGSFTASATVPLRRFRYGCPKIACLDLVHCHVLIFAHAGAWGEAPDHWGIASLCRQAPAEFDVETAFFVGRPSQAVYVLSETSETAWEGRPTS